MAQDNQTRSFSQVLDNIVGDVQTIIRSEVRLAKVEIQEETVKAGKAAGMLGSGAVLALYAVGFLFLTGMFALELVVAAWLAALIVAVVIAIAAAILINIGRQRTKRVNPRPVQTINTMKENLEWAKRQAK
jgi:uncharacterized membrane protein YqjE